MPIFSPDSKTENLCNRPQAPEKMKHGYSGDVAGTCCARRMEMF